MFKAMPPPDIAPVPPVHAYPPPEALRRRARELALAELKHQPLLKLRAFTTGLLVGIALTAGLEAGYHFATDSSHLALEALFSTPALPAQGPIPEL